MEPTLNQSPNLIIILLPLVAGLLVCQVNPYKALIIRGILGAIAALVYAILGAADVALTEALVGTMLAITLYAVAVRSSLVMRLGVLEPSEKQAAELPQADDQPLMDDLRTSLKPYQMRLERIPYPDRQAMEQALVDQDVHAICYSLEPHTLAIASPPGRAFDAEEKGDAEDQADSDRGRSLLEHPQFQLDIRIPRLYDILSTSLETPAVTVASTSLEDTPPAHQSPHRTRTASISTHNEHIEPAEGTS
jgi:putative multicomponent Na+:H+ antiporter subunit B